MTADTNAPCHFAWVDGVVWNSHRPEFRLVGFSKACSDATLPATEIFGKDSERNWTYPAFTLRPNQDPGPTFYEFDLAFSPADCLLMETIPKDVRHVCRWNGSLERNPILQIKSLVTGKMLPVFISAFTLLQLVAFVSPIMIDLILSPLGLQQFAFAKRETETKLRLLTFQRKDRLTVREILSAAHFLTSEAEGNGIHQIYYAAMNGGRLTIPRINAVLRVRFEARHDINGKGYLVLRARPLCQAFLSLPFSRLSAQWREGAHAERILVEERWPEHNVNKRSVIAVPRMKWINPEDLVRYPEVRPVEKNLDLHLDATYQFYQDKKYEFKTPTKRARREFDWT